MHTKVTEQSSLHSNLEQLSTEEILKKMNEEDQKVATAVAAQIPAITAVVDAIVSRFEKGGRLFYIGAGTSGRLGILDASEIPPTFGMPYDKVIGIIAGGDTAIRKAVENAEDNTAQAWKDIMAFNPKANDVVIGIAASGSTPYVIGGVKSAKDKGLFTACIVNNPNSDLSKQVDTAIEINVGPEFVTGSTRMKSGTAQKMALNMISTAVMIRIGRVKGNKMVNMQLSNDKLVDRGTRYIMEALQLTYAESGRLLATHGSVQKAIDAYKN